MDEWNDLDADQLDESIQGFNQLADALAKLTPEARELVVTVLDHAKDLSGWTSATDYEISALEVERRLRIDASTIIDLCGELERYRIGYLSNEPDEPATVNIRGNPANIGWDAWSDLRTYVNKLRGVITLNQVVADLRFDLLDDARASKVLE
ncbi:hypothetical protein SAMN05660642_03048 [Geodermatophilus siccatus]|uniref:Uncharacterized protein n=2 Tax=Geodermatophilus siccatus TaxID=1137991 RepID=A0A1G9V1T5_9ACTN|nr:hypothetical protein SAMN05660642_03048 [Geodermatophilus siccatus]